MTCIEQLRYAFDLRPTRFTATLDLGPLSIYRHSLLTAALDLLLLSIDCRSRFTATLD